MRYYYLKYSQCEGRAIKADDRLEHIITSYLSRSDKQMENNFSQSTTHRKSPEGVDLARDSCTHSNEDGYLGTVVCQQWNN